MANEFVTRNGLLSLDNSVISGSLIVTNGITGSLLGTSSISVNALTASSADNLTVRGTLTAQTIVVQTITSSTDFVTGSTRFGTLLSNTHQFTGSVSVTGSFTMNGPATISNLTGSLFGTSSWATSASFAISSSNATTASYVLQAVSASFASTASFIPTSSLVGNFFVQGGNSFGTQALIGTNDTQNLAFETSGSVRMFVSSSGLVGIGTTSPTATLDVSGSIRTNTNLFVQDAIGIGIAPSTSLPIQILKNQNTTVGIRFENTNTGANAFAALQMGEDINSTGTKFVNFVYASSGVSRYGVYVPQGTSIVNVGSGGLNLGTVGGGVSFYRSLLDKGGEMFSSGNWYLGTGLTPSDNGARLQVSGSATFTGNVGIGTSSPVRIFTINGGSSSSRVLLQNTNSGFTIGNGFDIVLDNSGNTQVWNYQNGVMQFATNNTERMRIDASGNVGIGTTSPSQLVEAYQSANADVVYQVTNPNTGGAATAQFFASNGTNRTQFYHTGTSWTTSGAIVASQGGMYNQTAAGLAMVAQNASGVIRFATGGTTERVRIDASGNVGIGTTSPSATLDVVYGTTRLAKLGTGIVFTSTTTAQAWMGSENWGWTGAAWSRTASSAAVIWGTGNNAGAFEVWTALTSDAATTAPINSNSRFIVTNGGNVGIGTTSPGEKLHVVGKIRIFDAGYPYIDLGINTSNYWRIINDNPSDTFVIGKNGTTQFTITSGGNVGIGTTSPGQLLQVHGGSLLVNTGTSATAYRDIMMGGIGGWATGESHGIDTVYGGSASPTTFTRIESYFDGSSASMYFRNFFNSSSPQTSILMTIRGSGNVGIGTTNPNSILHLVSSNNTRVLNMTGATTGYQYIQMSNTSGNLIIGVEGSTTGQLATGDLAYSSGIYTVNTTALQFGSNQVVAMTIVNGGNVGIGTTSPNEKLHVTGNIHAYAAGGIDAGLFASTAAGSTTIAIRSNGATYFNGGNVGIGVTSPQAPLHVIAANSSNDALIQEWSYTAGTTDVYSLMLKQTVTANVVRYNFSMVNNSTAYNDVLVLDRGNVGIGTTSPSSPLHIFRSSNPFLRIQAGGGDYSYIQLDDGSSNGYLIKNTTSSTVNGALAGALYTYTDNNRAFQHIHNGTALFTILSSGNVGIGTTSPSARLFVSGSTNVVGVQGSGSAAPLMFVDGANGRLFEVTDDLSNSLFSVNTIAGLPVIEAFANNCVSMGQFGGHKFEVTCTSIRGGKCTSASGYLTFVGGGKCNTASGYYSFIGGGGNNCATGTRSFIGGGYNNTTSGIYYYSTIVNGEGNCSTGAASFIGAGVLNTASSNCSAIVGGACNQATCNFSTVGGGSGNCATNFFSTVGGGCTNRAQGTRSTISGGDNNIASGQYSFVGGGFINTASGYMSSVLGGRNNNINGYTNSHIVGSCIGASANNYTYVNNLCQTGGGISDCRVKNTIQPLEFGLDHITKLQPVSFCWNGDVSCHKKYGFIAQNVQQAMSCVVTCNPLHKLSPFGTQDVGGVGESLLEFEKDAVYASYVNAFKDLKAENDALKQRIDIIENILKQNGLL